jgi:hypothetical protein
MSNAPLFEDPRVSERIAKDPQISAMIARAQQIRLIAGLGLLVVLATILLLSYFR